MVKNKHKWEFEYTSLGLTSAYCIECGMHRIQEWKDGANMYNGKWIGTYFKNGIKQKKAGNCNKNITNEEIKKIFPLLHNGRGIKKLK
jgi:hypothetical protein